MIQGVGIDLVEIARIEKAVRRWGEHFLRKVLTTPEIEYCCRPTLKIHSVAARFAAKEALFKSLPVHLQRLIGWQDVQIIHDADGKPLFEAVGRKRELFLAYRIHLSLSHGRETATAVVICEQYGGAE